VIREFVEIINTDSIDGPYSASLLDVLATIRGPDCFDTDLKQRTTARIRGAIGIKSGAYLDVRPWSEITDSDLCPYKDTYFDKLHFGYHVKAAVEGLRKLGYIE